jgi:hypothetical protein
MPINDDELEHAEEAQEDDDGMQWVILYFFQMRFSCSFNRDWAKCFFFAWFSFPSSWFFYR